MEILIGENPEAAGEWIRLSGESLRVGRAHCDITLSHPSVSREHAMLLYRPEGWVLADADSRNGTRVNGVSIVRRVLRDGDRVYLGSLEFVYREIEDDPVISIATEDDSMPTEPVDETDQADYRDTGMKLDTDREKDEFPLRETLRRFTESGLSGCDFRSAIDSVVNDFKGMSEVRRVILHLPAKVSPEGQDLWLRGGPSESRPGIVFPEARMLKCALAGRSSMVTCGREKEIACDLITDCDALCLTIAVEKKNGFLYLEARDVFPREVIDTAMTIAEGLGLAFSIWQTALGRFKRTVGTFVTDKSPLLVGGSDSLQKAVRLTLRAAAADSTILLRGESGTGKELFARLIYAESERQRQPFVPVHCSAIEETLMGSTLFGHEKGAFTGAVGLKKGLFEVADGGIIFLDEIGELGLDTQVKLLRVLQEGEFMRVGGVKPLRVDVRVLAATNRDLEKAVREGLFREDLYYRIKVLQIELPPLRRRRQDIPELARHFVAEFSENLATSVRSISPEAMERLSAYDWPGNVRELRNIIERGVVLADGDTIEPDDLPPELAFTGTELDDRPDSNEGSANNAGRLIRVEREHIRKVLAECDGNKRLAAQRLGISRSTLYEKLKNAMN